jgi:CRISPR-associated protein Cas2
MLSASAMRSTYLVCYDICNPLRLAKVGKTMRGFGDRVQYSIFECRFTKTDLVKCQQRLSKIINAREDQVMFVNLGPVDGRADRVISTIGVAYGRVEAPCLIVDGDTVRLTPGRRR